MDLDLIVKWWKSLASKMNDNGIPMPLVKDPKSGRGSVSLTLVFISFNLCVAGIIGKYAKMLEGVDVAQALNLFMACAALYFGRKMQKDPKGAMSVEAEEKKEDNPS